MQEFKENDEEINKILAFVGNGLNILKGKVSKVGQA